MTRRLIGVLLGCVALAASARAETIGVVMVHGKHGTPAQLQQLDSAVTQIGFTAERPEMCWSRSRIYDRAYLDCFADIDAAAARLKARGATAIVILGMSLGGNGALGYGARRPGLKGVIALAPASEPDRLRQRPNVAQSVAQAQALVAAGKGNEKQNFTDLNNGQEFTVSTTPTIFLSFVGKDSPAHMPANAAHFDRAAPHGFGQRRSKSAQRRRDFRPRAARSAQQARDGAVRSHRHAGGGGRCRHGVAQIAGAVIQLRQLRPRGLTSPRRTPSAAATRW